MARDGDEAATGLAGSAGSPPELHLDHAGWVSEARRVDSPNRDARPPGCAIELVVVHCISLPPGRFGGGEIERLFTNRLDCGAHEFFAQLRGLRVSAHFLIARDGTVTQFVSCADRAWHAGISAWEGRPGCNDFSVGVELEGSEFEPFTAAQYGALGALQRALRGRYPIRAVRGHEEIAPGRKFDPGPLFDWTRVSRD
jgi:AmpD protein